MSRLPTDSLNENFAWLNWNIPPKKNNFSWHLIKTVGQHILNKLYIYLAGFLKTLPPNRPLPSNSFLSAKNYFQYKKPLLFFSPLLLSSSSLFLFLLSFSFAGVIFDLIGRKKPAFWQFFTQMAANFARFVFKKWIFNNYSSSPNGLWVNSPWVINENVEQQRP